MPEQSEPLGSIQDSQGRTFDLFVGSLVSFHRAGKRVRAWVRGTDSDGCLLVCEDQAGRTRTAARDECQLEKPTQAEKFRKGSVESSRIVAKGLANADRKKCR